MTNKAPDKLDARHYMLYVFCDGGARGNPGPAAIGFLIKDSRGRVLVEKGELIGRATNNVAEYMAVIKSLQWIIENQKTIHYSSRRFNRDLPTRRTPAGTNASPGLLTIHYYIDSKLVVNQLNGLYKIKNSKLMELVIQARGLENQIKGKIVYCHIPREKNKEADKLLNQTLNKYSSSRS